MTSLTRGPLPASVYWRRRAILLGLFVAVVLLLRSVFGGGGDDDGKDSAVDRAAQVSEESTETPDATDDESTAPKTTKNKKSQKQTEPTGPTEPQEPVLADPDSACDDSDILITPSVEEAVAGRPVVVGLELRTAVAEACTWRVSAKHVTMKITSGSDLIWTSQQCPRVIPVQDVVVRNSVTTFVDVRWNARRSDDGCPKQTDWARVGTYHVYAAALGGEPAEATFQLEQPSPEVIPPEQNPTKPKQNPNQPQGKPKPQKPNQ